MRTTCYVAYLLFAFMTRLCLGQDLDLGLRQYGPYIHSELTHINLQNGNIYGQVPLVSYTQRGKLPPLSFFLNFNTSSFSQQETCFPFYGECYIYYQPPQLAGVQLQHTYTAPTFSNQEYQISTLITDPGGMAGSQELYEQAFTLTDLSGSVHRMLLDSTNQHRLYAADGSGYRATLSGSGPLQPYEDLRDATIVFPDGTSATPRSASSSGNATIFDVLGKTVQLTYRQGTGIHTGVQEPTIVDSLGRVFPDLPGAQAGDVATFIISGYSEDVSQCPDLRASGQVPAFSISMNFPGSNGTTAPYLLCYAKIAYHTGFISLEGNESDLYSWPNVMPSGPAPCAPPDVECPATSLPVNTIGEFFAIQSVVLPDAAGTIAQTNPYWGFIYDSSVPVQAADGTTYSSESYGTLKTLLYPTGAQETFTYTNTDVQPGATRNGSLIPANRSVVSVTRSSGSGPVAHSSYDYSLSHGAGLQWVNVSDDLGSVTEHILTQIGPQGRFEGPRTYETKTIVHSGNKASKALQVTSTRYRVLSSCDNTNYIGFSTYCTVLPEQVDTYADGTLVKSESFEYPALFTGTVVVKNVFGVYSQGDPAPLSIKYSTPETITTADGSGTALRTTVNTPRYLSDSGTKGANLLNLVLESKVKAGDTTYKDLTFKYDENNTSPGVFGNLTSMHSWLNTGGETVSSAKYNDEGKPTLLTDPNGNKTFVTWQCSGMYPESITKAYQSTTTISQTYGYLHDCGTGSLTQQTDPNGVVTTYGFNDQFGRLTSVRSAVGSSVEALQSFSYPSLNQVNISQDKDVKDDGKLKSSVLYDGFGRVVQEQMASGALIDTVYDDPARKISRSNAHLSGAALVFEVSESDALGRVTTLTHTDGTSMLTEYLGLTAKVTDEASNARTRTTDALGRLTAVTEPSVGGAQSQTTSYSYDPVNNMTGVNQPVGGTGSHARSFTYDSLSRLLTATNPETGTICYGQWNSSNCVNGYDRNGNLLAKTDARGRGMLFSYDALNRMSVMRHFDASGMTGPVKSYFYDGVNAPGALPVPAGANQVGRLSMAGSWAPFGARHYDEYFTYDKMGRLSSQTNVAQSEMNTAGHTVTAGYDLVGNLTSLTYPDGRTLTQSYDPAGRLYTISDGNGTNYVTSVSYFPNGTPQMTTTLNVLSQQNVLNTRQQVCETIYGSAYGVLMNRRYFFGLDNTAGTQCNAAAGNNGNILHVMDAQNSLYLQHYTYDALNRLTQWNGASVDGTIRQQRFGYDPYGNMAAAAGSTTPDAQTLFGPDNRYVASAFHCNNLDGTPASYDAAGNMLCTGNQASASQVFAYNEEEQTVLSWSQQFNNAYSLTSLYSYDSRGQRIRSDQYSVDPGQTDWMQLPASAHANWREYTYFNGEMLAEKDQNGLWTDYIYGNGRKIAKVASASSVLHNHGVRDQRINMGCGTNQWQFGMGGAGYTIRTGDRLFLRQKNSVAIAGMDFLLTDGSYGYQHNLVDQNGVAPELLSDTAGQWVTRVVDLNPIAGLTIQAVLTDVWNGTPAGTWDVYYSNIDIFGADGTVRQVFNGQALAGTLWHPCGVSDHSSATEQVAADGTGRDNTVTFYAPDQVGTAQMEVSASGYPLWKGEFAPFGEEIDNQLTTNRYKFTGKERDAESGLDYFGARYYASSMGRWMSPDWADKPEAVPYSSLDNPQSLNLYGYVLNNPLSKADPDGHDPWTWALPGGGTLAGVAESIGLGALAAPAAITGALGAGWAALNSAADQAYFGSGGNFNTAGAPMSGMSLVKQEDGAKSVPNPNGSKGAPDHQQTAAEEAAKMGPNGEREVRVQTPGGEKGSRVIDAAKVENGKVTEATQVVRTNKNGTPVAREVRAARDIQKATGVQPKLIPVRPLKDPQ